MTYNQILLVVYVVYLIGMSLATFIAYGKDKEMAGKGTEVRIKEKILLELTVFGGAVGAYAARLVFRHKTQKIYFSIAIYLSLVLQIAVFAMMLVLTFISL